MPRRSDAHRWDTSIGTNAAGRDACVGPSASVSRSFWAASLPVPRRPTIDNPTSKRRTELPLRTVRPGAVARRARAGAPSPEGTGRVERVLGRRTYATTCATNESSKTSTAAKSSRTSRAPRSLTGTEDRPLPRTQDRPTPTRTRTKVARRSTYGSPSKGPAAIPPDSCRGTGVACAPRTSNVAGISSSASTTSSTRGRSSKPVRAPSLLRRATAAATRYAPRA